MSAGQLLLTMGVALCVFDAKKLPQLLSHAIKIYRVVQYHYAQMSLVLNQKIQVLSNEQSLVDNERAAKKVEDTLSQRMEE